MKRFLIAVLVAVTTLTTIATQAGATPQQQDDRHPSENSQKIAGNTANQLLGEEFRQLLELPVDANPLAGNGDNCLSAGHKEKILILFTVEQSKPPAVCEVKPGTPVFFSSLFAECSSVEDPPFFGATEQAQRECVRHGLEGAAFDAILVTIDGGSPVSIGLESFLVFSGHETVDLPDPNILGVPGNQQTTFVVGAYSLLLRPLPPGSHTITVEIVGGEFAGTNRALVEVTPGHGH